MIATSQKGDSGALPRILVIDDSASICSFVADLLSCSGYDVRTAGDGYLGLELVPQFRPDVVLLDVEMPGISGLEVLARLSTSTHYFSIIMFTSLSALPQIVEALHMGADDYITKPFHNEELLARVEAAIRTARMKVELIEARQRSDAALAHLKIAQDQLVVGEKVAAVARLSAGVAHNINNPLGFILSNLSSLDRYASAILAHADSVSKEMRESGSAGSDTVDRLEKEHRIRQIRGDLKPLIVETREGFERIALIVKRLSRLELGLSQQQNIMDFDLVAALEALVQTHAGTHGPGIDIRWQGSAELLPVRGALTLLNAAFEELLTNAVESIAGVGSITIGVDQSGNEAHITICDTGSGIPGDVLGEIFDPFFTTRQPQEHVGLGLTIAERFIDLLGGRIAMQSQPGTGTIASVNLPLRSTPRQ